MFGGAAGMVEDREEVEDGGGGACVLTSSSVTVLFPATSDAQEPGGCLVAGACAGDFVAVMVCAVVCVVVWVGFLTKVVVDSGEGVVRRNSGGGDRFLVPGRWEGGSGAEMAQKDTGGGGIVFSFRDVLIIRSKPSCQERVDMEWGRRRLC